MKEETRSGDAAICSAVDCSSCNGFKHKVISLCSSGSQFKYKVIAVILACGSCGGAKPRSLSKSTSISKKQTCGSGEAISR